MKIKKFNENIDTKKITIISGDDWEGLYYKGKLVDEGHSLHFENVLKKLGFYVNSEYLEEEDWETLDNHCPEKLEDINILLNTKKYNL